MAMEPGLGLLGPRPGLEMEVEVEVPLVMSYLLVLFWRCWYG